MAINPWVEVTCSYCGALAYNSGRYYNGIISKLRKECKENGWHEKDGNIYCPKCWLDMKQNKTFHSGNWY